MAALDAVRAPHQRALANGERTHAQRRLQNIGHYDHHHFHGWCVSLKRQGQRHVRYFRDMGDRSAALRRAVRWRDRMIATLPPPRKFKSRYSLNRSGVIGVHDWISRTRKGRRIVHWAATWVEEDGRIRKRSFSSLKYGREEARRLAIEARKAALAVLLLPSKAHFPRKRATRRAASHA